MDAPDKAKKIHTEFKKACTVKEGGHNVGVVKQSTVLCIDKIIEAVKTATDTLYGAEVDYWHSVREEAVKL